MAAAQGHSVITISAPSLPAVPAARSSALIAGWICVGLGFLTFWIFGFGFVFFSVAMVCSVVAMCTDQVQKGLILLLSSFASLFLCGIIFFVLILGTLGAVAVKASEDAKRQQQRLPRSR